MLTLYFSAKKLSNGEDVLLLAEVEKEGQYITCYVMCDEIGKTQPSYSLIVLFADHLEAGTLRYAEVKPQLSASAFPTISTTSPNNSRLTKTTQSMNIRKGYSRNDSTIGDYGDLRHDEEFPIEDVDERDLLAAGKTHWVGDYAVEVLKMIKRMGLNLRM